MKKLTVKRILLQKLNQQYRFEAKSGSSSGSRGIIPLSQYSAGSTLGDGAGRSSSDLVGDYCVVPR